jgi:hypothetical protein
MKQFHESALKPVHCSIAPESQVRGNFGGLGLLRVRVHVTQPMAL